jgi:hypothetical protein
MRSTIVLPQLLRFKAINFSPIFSSDASLTLKTGTNIILGGNGLGKTTLMQAIVYGLTGGSREIETEKSLRWDHRYFRSRLGGTNARHAAVEVEFAFKNVVIGVRRGFAGPYVTALRLGVKHWNDNPKYGDFARALLRYGGYKSEEDFAFIVHRLLYLPESRKLLAWDTDAQTRLLMLINQDVAPEADFQSRRAQLKELDSKKRHIHVAVGKAQTQLSTLMEFDDEEQTASDAGEDGDVSQTLAPTSASGLGDLVSNLHQVALERTKADRELTVVTRSLSEVSGSIEELQQKVDNSEAELVLTFISEQERESELALAKLLQFGVCPACGTHRKELHAAAIRYARDHLCTLCGSEVPSDSNDRLATLRSQMHERLSAQKQLEDAFRLATNRREELRRTEQDLQATINEIRFTQPVVTLTEAELPVESLQGLKALKADLDSQESELAAQIEELSSELQREYSTFMRTAAERLSQVRSHYSAYATEFLGLDCTLAEVGGGDRMLGLMKFVPHFNGVERDSPESCSEAQRFFLDIAFRMALIDLATELTSHKATFLCETPENALDMSYVSNVVNMFLRFAKRGHNLLLTANIQLGGIAQQLLRAGRPSQRRGRFLNLLDIGQLSKVHKQTKRRLDQVVLRMVR